MNGRPIVACLATLISYERPVLCIIQKECMAAFLVNLSMVAVWEKRWWNTSTQRCPFCATMSTSTVLGAFTSCCAPAKRPTSRFFCCKCPDEAISEQYYWCLPGWYRCIKIKSALVEREIEDIWLGPSTPLRHAQVPYKSHAYNALTWRQKRECARNAHKPWHGLGCLKFCWQASQIVFETLQSIHQLLLPDTCLLNLLLKLSRDCNLCKSHLDYLVVQAIFGMNSLAASALTGDLSQAKDLGLCLSRVREKLLWYSMRYAEVTENISPNHANSTCVQVSPAIWQGSPCTSCWHKRSPTSNVSIFSVYSSLSVQNLFRYRSPGCISGDSLGKVLQFSTLSLKYWGLGSWGKTTKHATASSILQLSWMENCLNCDNHLPFLSLPLNFPRPLTLGLSSLKQVTADASLMNASLTVTMAGKWLKADILLNKSTPRAWCHRLHWEWIQLQPQLSSHRRRRRRRA